MSSITIKDVAKGLAEDGTLSPAAADSLASQPRTCELADIPLTFAEPVFSCFLFDSSYSMEPYRQNVIDGQLDLIKALRASSKCKKDALFVVQYLFSNTVTLLNPFEPLSPKGPDADNVVVMGNGNHYNPDGCTALYKSIFYLLQDMAANITNARNNNMLKCSFTIGVITDGEDTEGGVQLAEIKTIINELQSKGILRSSVIVGLTNPNFTTTMLNEMKSNLGFQEAISLSQNPREIRRAFLLMSQSAVAGQQY